jgi:hypothetical protein
MNIDASILRSSPALPHCQHNLSCNPRKGFGSTTLLVYSEGNDVNSWTLSIPNFVQRASRKVVKKPFELCSDKYHTASPDPEGNLVPGNTCSQRLFCDAQESGRFSNIEENSVDGSVPKAATRFLDWGFVSHDLE